MESELAASIRNLVLVAISLSPGDGSYGTTPILVSTGT